MSLSQFVFKFPPGPADFIDVGSCGFRTVAIWLIDYIEHIEDPWLQKQWTEDVWKILCALEPSYCNVLSRDAKISKKMQHIVITEPKIQVVSLFTKALANLACEELSSNPTRYRDVLQISDLSIDNAFLQANCMYIIALARVMQLSLTLFSFLHHNKTYKLIRCTDSADATTQAHLILKHHIGDYFHVYMSHKMWLNDLSAPLSIHMPDEYAASMSWVVSKVIANEKLLLKKYDEVCLRLITQYEHGLFKKEDGIDLYIKLLFDYKKSSFNQATSQKYFDTLFLKHRHQVLGAFRKVDNELILHLIQAISRLVALISA